ncbi:hypothetical protein ABW20_dc0101640 [Dactylellina cionopaga]|nr:hypothetical protein ABW20_dc0101640 [Dactylellina cionopaga]
MTIKKIELDDIMVCEYTLLEEPEDVRECEGHKAEKQQHLEQTRTKQTQRKQQKYAEQEIERRPNERSRYLPLKEGPESQYEDENYEKGIIVANSRDLAMLDRCVTLDNPAVENMLMKREPRDINRKNQPIFSSSSTTSSSSQVINSKADGFAGAMAPFQRHGNYDPAHIGVKRIMNREIATQMRHASFGSHLAVPRRPQHDLRRASYQHHHASQPPSSARPDTSFSTVAFTKYTDEGGSQKKTGKFKRFLQMF